MALWSNTADGWGSDPSSSGNGALAAYLQSSSASSPKLPSGSQAQDPGNSMPTSSIARTVQPARTNTLVQSVMAQPVVQAAPVVQTAPVAQPSPFGVSRVKASIAQPSGTNFVAPTAVAAPTYSGQDVIAYQRNENGTIVDYIYKFNPATGGYDYQGRRQQDTGEAAANLAKAGIDPVSYWAASPNDPKATAALQALKYGQTLNLSSGTNQLDTADLANQLNSANYNALKTYQDASAATKTQNQSNLRSAQNASYRSDVMAYLYANGGKLPPVPYNSLDSANLNAIQQDALAEYQANQVSAAAIKNGIAPVDTSTQNAINQASLGAVSSRFSTNNYGNNVAAMGRLFAQAAVDQGGVNKQLSDEDFANRFNQNQAQFTQAVQNQATLDSNATGAKLQSDIQAVSDVVDQLNQSVTQYGTQSSLAVSGQLNEIQKQINAYLEAVQKFGNESSLAVGLAKGILGAAAAVTSIALAPVTGGASVAAGVAAGAAIAKA